MSFQPTALRTVVALLGLIAVLLGALEHEDLLFQESPTAGAPRDPLPTAKESGLGWEAERSDSGTESRFRQETHRGGFAAEPAPSWKRAFALRHNTADGRGQLAAQRTFSRKPVAGSVALRL